MHKTEQCKVSYSVKVIKNVAKYMITISFNYNTYGYMYGLVYIYTHEYIYI